MEAYESIMDSTRAPFSILPKPIDEDGNTVTTTGGADDDRYPLVQDGVRGYCTMGGNSGTVPGNRCVLRWARAVGPPVGPTSEE